MWTVVVVLTMAFATATATSETKAEAKASGRMTPKEEFVTLLRHKRIEHLTAVKQLLKMESERQTKLLDTVIVKISEVMAKARTQLEASNWVLGQSNELPTNKEDRDALSILVENTCFLGDILLRFPDFVHEELSTDSFLLFKWSLALIRESDFVDEHTAKLLHLAAQEIGLVEKEPEYHNPYRIEKKAQKKFEDPPPEKRKEKKKIKKGPRMTRSEL